MRRSKWVLTMGFAIVALGAGVALTGAGQEEDDETRIREQRVIEIERGRAFLGVDLEEETDHPEGGARITSVVDGSPADAAGLREDDIVIRFDGVTIRGPAGLSKQIREKQPGDRATLVVLREGKRVELEAELGKRAGIVAWRISPEALEEMAWVEAAEQHERSAEEMRELAEELKEGLEDRRLAELEHLRHIEIPKVFWNCEGADCDAVSFGVGRARLGVQLVDATPELRAHLGAPEEAGVLVSKVLTGTPAESAGIRVGDLIVSVGGESVADVSDLRRGLADRAGTTFPVEVVRDGSRVTVQVTLPDESDEPASGPRAYFLRSPRPAPAPPARPAPVTAVPAPAAAPIPPAPPAPPARPALRHRYV